MVHYKIVHFTDWCDYHVVHDAHTELSDDIDVLFVHEKPDFSDRISKFLLFLQQSRKINRILPVNRISIINKHIAKKILPPSIKPNETCLLFSSLYAQSLHISLWPYLKSLGFKLALMYVDKVSLTPKLGNIKELKNIFDLICTYNVEEAQRYSIEVHPIRLSNLTYLRSNEIEKDVFFIGSEKGRIKEINALYDACFESGLKCDFYVAGYSGSDKRAGINYITRISYEDSLEKASRAKAIVNLLQPESSGFTLRDIEAYNLGSYIITNNEDNNIAELYQKGQIIDINKSDFQEQLINLRNPFTRFERKPSKYTYDYFYSWINERIQ